MRRPGTNPSTSSYRWSRLIFYDRSEAFVERQVTQKSARAIFARVL
jgi:hypothetical protein